MEPLLDIESSPQKLDIESSFLKLDFESSPLKLDLRVLLVPDMKDEVLEMEGRLLSLVPPLATDEERAEGLSVDVALLSSVFDVSSVNIFCIDFQTDDISNGFSSSGI